jgi:hypothetical protein
MQSNRKKTISSVVGVAMLLTFAGCSNTATAVATVVASKDVGSQWPFTVPEVNVVCAPSLAIFVTADGKLNDIWKVAPEISKLLPDARMPLDAVTRKAIETCAKAGKWEPSKTWR